MFITLCHKSAHGGDNGFTVALLDCVLSIPLRVNIFSTGQGKRGAAGLMFEAEDDIIRFTIDLPKYVKRDGEFIMATPSDSVTVKSFGVVSCNSGGNRKTPYEHQKKAMECLDKIDREPDYITSVVLPTGGGKTYTASVWLLKHAIDRKKNVLWIQMLLD